MENGIENVDGRRPARSWSFTALHRNTNDSSADGYCGQPDVQKTYGREHPGMNLSDWQIWGGLWVGDLFCTYLNGVPITCMTGYDSSQQPMHLMFSIAPLPRCPAECGPRPPELWMEIDFVRVWQRA
jgi:hypothetical protein